MIDEAEASLVAAVESREAPLAVYADWLEDRGDERAVGMRWLADHDRRPRFDIVRVDEPPVWQWHLAGNLYMRNQLPRTEVKDHLPGKPRWGVLQFASFADALDAASIAVTAAIRAGSL